MNAEQREQRPCIVCQEDTSMYTKRQHRRFYYNIVMPDTGTQSVICYLCYNREPYSTCNNFDGSCSNYFNMTEQINYCKTIMNDNILDVVDNSSHDEDLLNLPCLYFCMECIHKNIGNCMCPLCLKLETIMMPQPK
jgi:hypothetical protein